MKRIFILLTCCSLAAPLAGQICYSPAFRQRTTSVFKLDSLSSADISYRMDLSADPGAVGARPNPYFLELSDPAVRAAFEKRYGKYTACSNPATTGCDGHTHKRWAGGGNEVKSIWSDALVWWFQNHPELLGPPCGGNGKPTEVELTDVLATNDLAIIIEHHTHLEGGSPENPLHVCKNDRTKGPFDEQDSFWPWRNYYFNDCGAPKCGDGVCEGTETHQTCPADCPAPCPKLQPIPIPPDVSATLTELQRWNILGAGRHARTRRVKEWVSSLERRVCGPDAGAQRCGDGVCSGTETHRTCPADCPDPCPKLQPMAVPSDVAATLSELQRWNVLARGRHARTKRVLEWVSSLPKRECLP